MMRMIGGFIERDLSWECGDLSAHGVIEGRAGINKGNATLLDVAGEWYREFGGYVRVMSWSNTGYPIATRIIPWCEANEVEHFRLAVREGLVKLQPDAIAQLQDMYGPRSVRLVETHAEIAMVDDRVLLGSAPTMSTGMLEWYKAGHVPGLVEWFDSLPVAPLLTRDTRKQMSLDDILGGWDA
jgi:hypothetical protein